MNVKKALTNRATSLQSLTLAIDYVVFGSTKSFTLTVDS